MKGLQVVDEGLDGHEAATVDARSRSLDECHLRRALFWVFSPIFVTSEIAPFAELKRAFALFHDKCWAQELEQSLFLHHQFPWVLATEQEQKTVLCDGHRHARLSKLRKG